MSKSKKKQISLTLSEEALEILDNYSKKIGLPRNQTIELMLKGLVPPPKKKYIELPIKD